VQLRLVLPPSPTGRLPKCYISFRNLLLIRVGTGREMALKVRVGKAGLTLYSNSERNTRRQERKHFLILNLCKQLPCSIVSSCFLVLYVFAEDPVQPHLFKIVIHRKFLNLYSIGMSNNLFLELQNLMRTAITPNGHNFLIL
jgi:hypothetical protein